MKKTTVVFVLALLVSVSAEAKDLYVNASTGNDGTTYAANGPSSPWRSIGRAAWGSTSRSAPNANEAARGGDTVIVAGGTYTTAGTSLRFTPAYNPANNGSASSPITFSAAPGTVVTLALSSGEGAQIGCRDRNYIVWDGFTINESAAPVTSDTGLVDLYGADHCELRNLTLVGANRAIADNHNGIRIENSDFTRVVGSSISRIYSNGTRGGNDAAIMLYDSNDSLIENNTMFDAGVGVFVKGIHPGETQDRTIVRKNLVHSMAGAGIMVLGSHYAKVYQNVIINSTFGLNVTGLSGNEPRDDTFQNNTVHNSRQSGIIMRGTSNAWQRMRFFNNLLTMNGETGVNTDSFASPGDATFEHNIYQNFPLGFAWLSGGFRTLAQWKSSFGKDNASPASISGDPLYLNAAGNDFRLGGSSPALSLGVDVLDLNGNGSTSDLIPAGAYITGSEVIGAAGGGAAGSTLPPAPRNLRITP